MNKDTNACDTLATSDCTPYHPTLLNQFIETHELIKIASNDSISCSVTDVADDILERRLRFIRDAEIDALHRHDDQRRKEAAAAKQKAEAELTGANLNTISEWYMERLLRDMLFPLYYFKPPFISIPAPSDRIWIPKDARFFSVYGTLQTESEMLAKEQVEADLRARVQETKAETALKVLNSVFKPFSGGVLELFLSNEGEEAPATLLRSDDGTFEPARDGRGKPVNVAQLCGRLNDRDQEIAGLRGELDELRAYADAKRREIEAVDEYLDKWGTETVIMQSTPEDEYERHMTLLERVQELVHDERAKIDPLLREAQRCQEVLDLYAVERKATGTNDITLDLDGRIRYLGRSLTAQVIEAKKTIEEAHKALDAADVPTCFNGKQHSLEARIGYIRDRERITVANLKPFKDYFDFLNSKCPQNKGWKLYADDKGVDLYTTKLKMNVSLSEAFNDVMHPPAGDQESI